MGNEGVRALAPNTLPLIWRHTLDRSDGDPTFSGMSTPDRNGPDIEAILNDLYASEINVSICISSLCDEGWQVKDTVHGFVAEKTFANAELDQAAHWLSEKASLHYPESDFARRFTQFLSARTKRKSLGRVSRG